MPGALTKRSPGQQKNSGRRTRSSENLRYCENSTRTGRFSSANENRRSSSRRAAMFGTICGQELTRWAMSTGVSQTRLWASSPAISTYSSLVHRFIAARIDGLSCTWRANQRKRNAGSMDSMNDSTWRMSDGNPSLGLIARSHVSKKRFTTGSSTLSGQSAFDQSKKTWNALMYGVLSIPILRKSFHDSRIPDATCKYCIWLNRACPSKI